MDRTFVIFLVGKLLELSGSTLIYSSQRYFVLSNLRILCVNHALHKCMCVYIYIHIIQCIYIYIHIHIHIIYIINFDTYNFGTKNARNDRSSGNGMLVMIRRM